MSGSRDDWARGVMSGADRSAKAATLRLLTGIAEPGYAAAMRLRNAAYDAGLRRPASLGRPTVSVGNLTTGGTGKTPVVRWLAERLREAGVKPAVLLRGYKVGASVESDEQAMLSAALGDGAVVEAGPSRIESAARVLGGSPGVGVFLLDDAFQHRKVARDFDLVLVNAADPWGFGHVLPRGLLREPLSGLRRADAIVLTRSDQATPEAIADIERTVRQHSQAPVYRASHTHVGFRSSAGVQPLGQLRQTPFFAFAGIGNPESLGRQLQGPGFVGHHWFPDHHDYSAGDLAALRETADRAGASCLVTTEKDWVKVSRLGEIGLPVYRLELEVRFAGDHGDQLLRQVLDAVGRGGGGGGR